MARPGITREQVFETAQSLSQEGQSPTVVAVRNRLGGGSPNNITRWLSEWREIHETQKQDSVPSMPDTVESAMRQVWGIAWRDAQSQLGAERDALAAARQAIELERNQIFAEIERLDNSLDQAKDEGKANAIALDQERRAHDQTRAEVREARAVATEREKRLDAQDAELRDIRRQLQEVIARNSRLESDLHHAQRDQETAAIEAKTERNERQQLTIELVKAKTIVDELQQQLIKAEADRDNARSDSRQCAISLESAERHARESRAVADAAGKKIQRLEKELEMAAGNRG